jgi:hypothetical protein
MRLSIRINFLIVLIILALPLGSTAEGWFSGGSFAALENANPRAYLDLTVSSAAVGFSTAQIQADGRPARYVRVSDEFVLIGAQIVQFKAIRTDAVDAVLHCTVYF